MGDLSGAADVSSPLAARAATIDLRRTSNMTGQDPSRSFAPAARDIGAALGFFTRMPVGANASAPLDLNRFAWAAPVAGATVGLVGALALALTGLIGLPHFIRAGLATAALVAATGALHEDGLADVADGFGGGATRAIKLDIMRDSRIGAYGAIALTLALILRVAALSAALDGGFWRASISLIAVAALSRAGALTPLALLEPARADGAGAAAGRLDPGALAAAWGSALVIALILGLASLGLAHAVAAALASCAAALGMVGLARRAIGGQTGDVAGAAQQAAEIAAWCGLLIGQAAS
jgi:adenosylcobinamide-GDP ribazoletransferase